MTRSLALILSLAALAIPSAVPDEGMWLPQIVHNPVAYKTLAEAGFELAPDAVWNPGKPALSNAMLMVGSPGEDPALPAGIDGYGSAAFVSSQGLVLTNHHVAYDAVAAASTPERNYIEEGFVAKTAKDELPCKGVRLQITTNIEDVTATVTAGIDEEADERERQMTIAQNVQKHLEELRKNGNPHCSIIPMRQGTRFYLHSFKIIRDVRMVYVPPRSVGEYGGDIDNWMWPRHTADFAYLRAYASPDGKLVDYDEKNVPYTPENFLELSAAGYKPGDFCFIMGHPGRTWRHRTSYSVEFWQNTNFPQQIKGLTQMREGLEAEGKDDPKKALEHASTIKSINNTLKNYEGQLAGLKALKVVQRRRAEEALLQKWIDADAKRKERWGHVLSNMADAYARLDVTDRNAIMQFNLAILPLRRQLIEARDAWQESPLYFDATMSLRLTYGKVTGYDPADGVHHRYVTTMKGIAEKDTGKHPFDAPKEQLELIAKKDWGRWADADLGSVPLCFLSDTDITGGNSGSPIMNGKGQMIGIAFDGNYEAMTGDFKFEDDLCRTISVDIRYVLWCTEKLAHLDRLIEEMVIREK